jgi:hypothetical protein
MLWKPKPLLFSSLLFSLGTSSPKVPPCDEHSNALCCEMYQNDTDLAINCKLAMSNMADVFIRTGDYPPSDSHVPNCTAMQTALCCDFWYFPCLNNADCRLFAKLARENGYRKPIKDLALVCTTDTISSSSSTPVPLSTSRVN